MNYKVKQRNAKLETWYICHKLGIKLNEWVEVRTSKRNLSSEKLDVFNELTYSQANEWINQEEEKRKIDEWYESQTSESLKNRLKEFNISQRIAANDIGCDTSGVCKVINNPETEQNNTKYLLYYYLNDEFNRRDNKKTSKTKETIINRKSVNLIDEEEQLQQEEPNTPTYDYVKFDYKNEDDKKEEVWYGEYQKMANKYYDTKEELDRYKFLIDEIRKREDVIAHLINLDIKEKVNE